jgi:hypothetical protein
MNLTINIKVEREGLCTIECTTQRSVLVTGSDERGPSTKAGIVLHQALSRTDLDVQTMLISALLCALPEKRRWNTLRRELKSEWIPWQ